MVRPGDERGCAAVFGNVVKIIENLECHRPASGVVLEVACISVPCPAVYCARVTATRIVAKEGGFTLQILADALAQQW